MNEWNTIEIKEGVRIYPDGWNGNSMNLVKYPYNWYDEICNMTETHLALPSARFTDIESPVVIKVTGRKWVRKYGSWCMKVHITWVKPDSDNTMQGRGYAVAH